MHPIERFSRTTVALGFGGASLLATGVAFAQDPVTPAGTLKQDAASAGKTDVATSGFEKPAAADDKPDSKDATELKISAGGLSTSGNSSTLALTTAANFRLRRDSEQFSAAAAGNYAQAIAPGGDGQTHESVENVQGKLRYDHFFVGELAGFLGTSLRHDRFQGLDLRLNIDPGVAYYFIDEKKHQLWGELGYDMQYDVRRREAVDAAAAAGTPVDKTQLQHGARAFAGYANKLNEMVGFNTDLEYVQSLQKSDHLRLNWDVGLSASVSSSFSIATTFLLQFDNSPLPGVKSTDTITSVNLVYTLK